MQDFFDNRSVLAAFIVQFVSCTVKSSPPAEEQIEFIPSQRRQAQRDVMGYHRATTLLKSSCRTEQRSVQLPQLSVEAI